MNNEARFVINPTVYLDMGRSITAYKTILQQCHNKLIAAILNVEAQINNISIAPYGQVKTAGLLITR